LWPPKAAENGRLRRQIGAYRISSTPGLVIDGKVMSYRRIPTAGDIALWLSE
jgi:hypothetical protein